MGNKSVGRGLAPGTPIFSSAPVGPDDSAGRCTAPLSDIVKKFLYFSPAWDIIIKSVIMPTGHIRTATVF